MVYITTLFGFVPFQTGVLTFAFRRLLTTGFVVENTNLFGLSCKQKFENGTAANVYEDLRVGSLVTMGARCHRILPVAGPISGVLSLRIYTIFHQSCDGPEYRVR